MKCEMCEKEINPDDAITIDNLNRFDGEAEQSQICDECNLFLHPENEAQEVMEQESKKVLLLDDDVQIKSAFQKKLDEIDRVESYSGAYGQLAALVSMADNLYHPPFSSPLRKLFKEPKRKEKTEVDFKRISDADEKRKLRNEKRLKNERKH